MVVVRWCEAYHASASAWVTTAAHINFTELVAYTRVIASGHDDDD